MENFVEAGAKYSKQGKYQESVDNYTEAFELVDKKDKATAELYNVRGVVYYDWDDKHYDEAYADFKEAIRLDPDVPDFYNNRACVSKQQGKSSEAKKDFLKAGILYLKASEYEDAAKALNDALDVDKDYGEAYYWLGEVETCLTEKNLSNEQEAIAKFDEAIRLGFTEDFVYTARGRAKYAMKDYDGAIKDFDKAIEVDVNHAEAYARRGETYFTLANPDYEQAQDDFQKYLELAGKNLDEETKELYEDKIKKCENAIRSSDPTEKINEAADKLGVGDVNYLLKFLIVVMILEYLMFIGCGLHERTLTGKAAAQEFAIKIIFLMFIMLAKALENWKFLEELEIRNATIAVILVLEFTTLLKGAKERLGIPVPDSIMNLVQTIEDGIKEKLRSIFGG
ncbi:MAG: tetratricopeptide repeat protein [Selenomonadaceae bacterium]|nr:tetratricopeptide repeat protein [Selenomonadaceae bacterium]